MLELKVHGDVVHGDAESDIELRRRWEIPQSDERFSAGVALNMTYDGWVIIATADGPPATSPVVDHRVAQGQVAPIHRVHTPSDEATGIAGQQQ